MGQYLVNPRRQYKSYLQKKLLYSNYCLLGWNNCTFLGLGCLSMCHLIPSIYNQYSNHQGEDLDYLDGEHCVFGELVEGWDILDKVNETICDGEDRPYQVSLLERFF